jgi:AICAR transformylase/IMP cyclohydrolase PurH
MIRAAAKNYMDVAVVVRTERLQQIICRTGADRQDWRRDQTGTGLGSVYPYCRL